MVMFLFSWECPPWIARAFISDDLRLFAEIWQKRFLSIPWKGLVIGVATDNYPLDTKPSTLTNKWFSYEEFMNLGCDNKLRIAKDYKIDYVYSGEFNCKGFELINKSSENLYLYKVSMG